MRMNMGINFRFHKKYIAFFFVVPVLTITSMININCPVCGGDGVISGMPAMENVKLIGIESREIDTVRDACSSFLMYNYDIKLSLVNEGKDTAVGFLKMFLMDFTQGKVLDIQYTVVEIPGETSLDIVYNIWFETGLDEKLKTMVNATVLTGDVPDLTCNGTGKIPLNTWPLTNQLKNSFQEVTRAERPFTSPAGWQWEEHIYENE
jgi:hypothetical protein